MRPLIPFITAILLVLCAPGLVAAQEASPAAEAGLPEGMSIAPIAQAVIDSLPPGPAEIGFIRLTFAPGARVPIEAEPGLAFVAVESGTLSAHLASPMQVTRVMIGGTPVAASASAAEAAFTLGPGESALFPPLVSGEVRNEGSEPVVLLAVFIGPAMGEMATPAAVGTPGADEEEAMAGVTFEPLAFGIAEEMPSGPAMMLIGRGTIAPGTIIPQHPELGMEFGHAESGSVTLRTSEGSPIQVVRGVAQLASPEAEPTLEAAGPGQEVTVSAGDAYFIPSGAVFGGEVAGDKEAVALIVVIEPLGGATATPEP
jgi:quercetin dioxygenase-like cupin family protein